MNNKLMVIAEDSSLADRITELVGHEFACDRIGPERFAVDDVAAYSIYVFSADIGRVPAPVYECIEAGVTKRNGVLILLASAIPADTAYAQFIGASAGEASPIQKAHVFPHYLTRGVPERLAMPGVHAVRLNLGEGFSPVADNVFAQDMGGLPLAFERVYGMGRVIVLGVGGGDGLCQLEAGVLANLHLLLHNAEHVDDGFSGEIRDTIAFHDLATMERDQDICRWNTLYTPDRKDIVYTHSAVFLPGSPEFCRRRVATITDEVTKESLWRSFCGLEIRNTDFCQQNCYYCYNRRDMDVRHKRVALPINIHVGLESDLIGVAQQIGHRFFVRYTGTGEPLRHERTLPSLLAFECAGIATALITNGALLSRDEARALRGNATFVRFSVDAADSRAYAAIRRCSEDQFGRVVRNIEMVSGGACFTGATFLVCRENFRQVSAFCSLMKSLGVRAVWIRSTDSCDPFTPDEMGRITAGIDEAMTLIDDGFIVLADQFRVYRETALMHYKYNASRCWTGHTKAFIQPNGDVIICLSRPDYVIGNVCEQPFSQIWGGPAHLRFLQDTDVSRCSQCIESRYHTAAEFLYRNAGATVLKGTRAFAGV